MGIDIGVNKEDNFLISKKYENSLDLDIKKSMGIYYTPKIIVEYIIENTLRNHDIVNNPYPKILDISCGCGNFLLEVYDVLYEMFEENIYDLRYKYNDDYWKFDNIHNHIISNCIYGLDIDENAIKILKQSLILKDIDLEVEKFNIYCEDGLKKIWEHKFDFVLGNPPYIGHKKLDKEYKKFLLKEYNEVYKDKSDVYFCFYKKIVDILDDKGICSVITPRYFLESPSGKYLRDFMKNNTNIIEIVDFLGANIFKNIGVSSCILTFNKDNNNDDIDIYKVRDENISIDDRYSLRDIIDIEFENYLVSKDLLGDEWMLKNDSDIEFYNIIQDKCKYTLEDIAESFQGIITGCDKAFILKDDDNRLKKISKDIIRPWLKNKDIFKYTVNESSHKLIYSNDIDDENKYYTTIRECIYPYKERLENRRECRKNLRKWYQLQWGREKSLFEREKIMYPYKSKENRFAIDYGKNFSSADVYSFFIKEEYKNEFSHEYIVALLNSSIYDRYFKITAKKMSKNIYDYYPNKVMKMKLFKDQNYDQIESLSRKIIREIKKSKNNNCENIKNMYQEIDILVEKSLRI